MSSTTEDSDWNMSPKSRRPHSLSNPDTGRPSPTEDTDPSHSTPYANDFAETATQLDIQLAQTLTGGNEFAHAHHLVPTNQSPTLNNGESSLHDTPEWEAARDAVLSQMVTRQDLDAVPTPTPILKVKRGGVKTGGRRGRGGRRPKIKIEGEDSVAAEIAAAAGVRTETTSTPTRGKNKGGRPRGSRAGISSRGAGITRDSVDSTNTTLKVKNKGGRPRGSKTVNRGGRPRGSRAGSSAAGLLGHIAKKKRKRGSDDEDDADDTDASEEFTPLAITSSGRRINPTQTYSPVVLEPSTTARKSSQSTPTSIPPIAAQKLKKRRKPGEAAVCINCGRGHSPNSNQIVFCDGCNTPWHQFCHDRPITPTVIQFEEKEWICTDCEVIREEKAHIAGRVADQKMTIAEKRTYLKGLEKNELVSLLVHASTLHEDLPIFRPPPPAPVPVIVEPQPIRPGQGPPDEEEYYEVYIEPDPLPYPKPGNGIVLPSEDEDLSLLIDEDIVTYSHLWKGLHGWEGPNGMHWPNAANAVGAGGGGMPIGVGA